MIDPVVIMPHYTFLFSAFALIGLSGCNGKKITVEKTAVLDVSCNTPLRSHSLCCLAGGTSLGSSRTFALIEEYCSERLWHASAPHDCISPPSWPPPLDLLGHTDGTVYVSVGGVYCLCVRVRVRAHKTPSPFTALLRAAAS